MAAVDPENGMELFGGAEIVQNGEWPSISMQDYGKLVIGWTDTYYEPNTVQYALGHLDRSRGQVFIDSRSNDVGLGVGTHGSVALNNNGDFVAAFHIPGFLSTSVVIRSGNLRNNDIDFHTEKEIGGSFNPVVAINDNGVLVDVHMSGTPVSANRLWSSLGVLDSQKQLNWQTWYDYDTGVNPGIAVNNMYSVEVHRSESLFGNALWYTVVPVIDPSQRGNTDYGKIDNAVTQLIQKEEYSDPDDPGATIPNDVGINEDFTKGLVGPVYEVHDVPSSAAGPILRYIVGPSPSSNRKILHYIRAEMKPSELGDGTSDAAVKFAQEVASQIKPMASDATLDTESDVKGVLGANTPMCDEFSRFKEDPWGGIWQSIQHTVAASAKQLDNVEPIEFRAVYDENGSPRYLLVKGSTS